MLRSPTRTSVIQAIIISTLSKIISDHLTARAFSSIDIPDSAELTTPDGNATVTLTISRQEMGRFFYLLSLARPVFCIVAQALFNSIWNLWLEKEFLARRLGAIEVLHDTARAQTPEDDQQIEEEIVKNWIAQGKLKRPIVNWGNAFVKWLLDLSFGNLVRCVLWAVPKQVLLFYSPARMVMEIRKSIFIRYMGCILSPYPLASLIGFIAVPAYKRIVFDAGVDLLWNALLGAFLGMLIPRIMSTELMQEALRNGTLASANASLAQINGSILEHSLEPVLHIVRNESWQDPFNGNINML